MIFDDVVLEDVPCPLGCNRGDDLVLTGHDRLHNLPGEFNVVRCRGCGLLRTNPRPSAGSIGFYYPDDYGPYLGTRVIAAKRATKIKNVFRELVKKIVNFNLERLPELEPGRMLEIGCASGSFLHRMAMQGWQVEGIEYSETAAKSAGELGYSVYVGSLETAPPPPEKFDLIVGWMVLEHLHDPIGGLRKLREWAKPNARLVLSVPNAASEEFRLFKSRWYALHLPNHLHHFTPKTLGFVLEASGWKLEKIYHQRLINNLIISVGYLMRDHGFVRLGERLVGFVKTSRGLAIFLYPIAWALSLIGQTGRMTVWARVDTSE